MLSLMAKRAKTTPAPKLSHHRAKELGEMLQRFYEMGYVTPRSAILFSFLKGVAAGFGAFLGGTIVIALLLWILSLFDSLPFIDSIRQQLQ